PERGVGRLFDPKPRKNWLDRRRLGRRFLRAGFEHRPELVALDVTRLDLLGPVAGDLVAGRELAERRHLIAAARWLHVRAARMESAGGWRIRGAGHVAGEQDRLALLLDGGIRDRHG